jgi:hypothetical protein
MFDRRFEWWKGVRRGFGIPSCASTARSAKAGRRLLEGRDYPKMQLQNSGLNGFQVRSNG